MAWLTGSDLTEDIWGRILCLLHGHRSRNGDGHTSLANSSRSWVKPCANQILLVMAKRAGRWIAGAIKFSGADTLYGRNWGAVEHYPFLQFELCYYHHRLCDRPQAQTGRSRCPRRAQAGPRLPAPLHLFSPFHRQSGPLRRAVAEYLARVRAYVQAAGERSLRPRRRSAKI